MRTSALELELEAVVSRPAWVLGTELKLAGRAASTLSLLAVEPSLQLPSSLLADTLGFFLPREAKGRSNAAT